MLAQIDQLEMALKKVIGPDFDKWLERPNPDFVSKRTNRVASPKQLIAESDLQPLWKIVYFPNNY